MIKEIQIVGFKSLGNVRIGLAPVTILLGKSGSGKSNFLDAVQFLRDLLLTRNAGPLVAAHGGWPRLITKGTISPNSELAFRIIFEVEGFPEDFEYFVRFAPPNQHTLDALHFREEFLRVGDKQLFHQDSGKWKVPPSVVSPPNAGSLLLGAITGLQPASLAYSVLAYGLGCYRFGDSVIRLTQIRANGLPETTGLRDDAANFISVVAELNRDVRHWRDIPNIVVALQGLKPTLQSITIDQPSNQQIVTAHRVLDLPPLTFDISQESEGFRRLFACLLALYQLPPKLTVLFDEPEKGIYPAGLAILADEFKQFSKKRGGQVILTTHSPEFLDHFDADCMRIVEMKNYVTHIGTLASEQKEAVKEHLLKPGELLTIDPARIADTSSES